MSQAAPFYRLGKFVYKRRFPIIFLWIFLIIACLPFIPNIVSPFKSTGFVDETSASAKEDRHLEKALAYGNNKILVSYYSKKIRVTNPLFLKKIKYSLSKLDNYPIKHDIFYPDTNKKQVSKDKHNAFVVISFKTQEPLDNAQLTQLKALIKTPKAMEIQLGGEPIFVDDLNKQTQKDLLKADVIAAPVSVIILILIFGSLVAAFIPILLGGGCALIILTLLYFLGHAFTLSIFTLNIALLLGLCLSLDYSLFFISRFRDELHKENAISEVIAITLSTAGKAIFFSGLAVFISLSALLIFPINILFSIGVGGLVAVFVALAISILLLPAILAVVHTRIDSFPVTIFKRKKTNPTHFWRWLATKVVNYPVIFFVFILVLLLLFGYPFYSVKFGISDFHVLPEHSESRVFFDNYKEKFNENELTPIIVVVTSDKNKILSKKSLSKLYDFSKKIKENPAVSQVNSIVTIDKKLTKKDYYVLYSAPDKRRGSAIKQLLKSTTRAHFTMMTVVSKYPANSAETENLIAELKKINPGKGLTFTLTGVPVNNAEVLSRISTLFPYALLWIIVLTYLILLLLLRSLFLPLKAILMNILSLTASYGVLVFIFQEGHFHTFLNFDPQGILDTSLLIIIFCALFGFSMDYEVFLLTRIKESYEITKDNKESIILGIENSSRIITSAAIVVIVLCGSFMVADVLMVKEFGLGIAVAIFVDAFLVRSILVPSTMVLVNKWNWYLPKWLDRILP